MRPVLTVPVLAVLALLASPALADSGQPAENGFPVVLLVLAVVAVVFALVYRAISRRKSGSGR